MRRTFAAMASLFDDLLESKAIAGGNLISRRATAEIESNEDKTPALGTHQAKALLEAPDKTTLEGLRDLAILAVLYVMAASRRSSAAAD
jgi:site-specific recombinase XerD